jgi:hypothetical protein
MNASGEEHTTDDSDTAGSEKGVRIGEGSNTTIRHVDLTYEQPTERALLRIELTPESQMRILSMVEREQDYEKWASQTELWLKASTLAVVALGLIAAGLALVFVGLNSKSAAPWGVVIGFAFGIVAGAACIWFSLRRGDKTSDNPHRDAR